MAADLRPSRPKKTKPNLLLREHKRSLPPVLRKLYHPLKPTSTKIHRPPPSQGQRVSPLKLPFHKRIQSARPLRSARHLTPLEPAAIPASRQRRSKRSSANNLEPLSTKSLPLCPQKQHPSVPKFPAKPRYDVSITRNGSNTSLPGRPRSAEKSFGDHVDGDTDVNGEGYEMQTRVRVEMRARVRPGTAYSARVTSGHLSMRDYQLQQAREDIAKVQAFEKEFRKTCHTTSNENTFTGRQFKNLKITPQLDVLLVDGRSSIDDKNVENVPEPSHNLDNSHTEGGEIVQYASQEVLASLLI
ncbi:hypothetical protein AAMO2058_001006900 [Amorphochlora amoebiformis]